jgi:hydrogenase maturation factor/predicted fused transcriptional regulator/phosphomethylpyrimidine kinase
MTGKISDRLFARAILPNRGAVHPEVIVWPQMGVDSAILKIGDSFMAIAEDPIFPSPKMSPEDFGWLTVHIGASDITVMGIKPRYMTYSLLLPPGTKEDYIERLTLAINKYAKELGIAITGGHTGFYGSVTIPTIGGITVWGTAKNYITPAGARIGDSIIITKGAAIEASALLAAELEDSIKAGGIDIKLIKKAAGRLRQVTVVKDARLAAEIDGVHAMHDATEGGVCRGLWEVAAASNVGMEIKRAEIPLPRDIKAICSYFNLNPYEVISEGTLILTCSPDKNKVLLEKFSKAGIDTAVIGEVIPPEKGCYWIEESGEKTVLSPPEVDRFWDVFFNALSYESKTQDNNEKKLCHELSQAVDKLIEAKITNLIPEIGSNIAYALPHAKKPEDIAAIPGRLLRFKQEVKTLGEPEMGCSKYMSGTLIEMRKYFPEARCIINLRNNDKIRNALKKLNYNTVSMPVPPGYRQPDEDFYRDLKLTLSSCKDLPDVIKIPDRLNLERLILVIDKDIDNLVEKVIALSKRVNQIR